MKTSIKHYLRLLKYIFIMILESLFGWLPSKKNRIVLSVNHRRGYTCNPKYIAEYLMMNHPGKYELIWITDYPETCTHLLEKKIKVVKNKSVKHFYYVMTAQVNITNDFFVFNKKKQLSINTWHGGGAYKKSGMAITDGIERIVHKITYRYTDYIISSSRKFTEEGEDMFGYEAGKFLPFGMPRNDVFFCESNKIKEKIYSKYSISNETKILLYAPTFREKGNLPLGLFVEYEQILDAVKATFGGEWVLFYRGHYFDNNIYAINDDFFNVSDYEDVQELLCVADVLITDYSSVMWDFGLTDKPCFLYVPDLEIYLQYERQFYSDICDWPYSSAKTVGELITNINQFNEMEYLIKVKAHYETLESYENGSATKKIVDLIDTYYEKNMRGGL